jgi:hypothetical protein
MSETDNPAPPADRPETSKELSTSIGQRSFVITSPLAETERLTLRVGPVIGQAISDAVAVGNAIEAWMKPLHESFVQIGRVVAQVHAQLAPVARALQPVVRMLASIDWEAWWQAEREAFLAGAAAGWFLQPEMPLRLVQLGPNGELPSNFEAVFRAELSSVLPDIESRLASSFPDRRQLIEQAFALHREGRYIASVPLFLNCAEGIVAEATNLSPFNLSGKSPEVAAWAKRLPLERLDEMLAAALTVKHPLSKHTGHSRHRINHGKSIDYGTETTSLGALSFLGFVGWLFCPNDGPLAKAAEKAGWERTSRGWQPSGSK